MIPRFKPIILRGFVVGAQFWTMMFRTWPFTVFFADEELRANLFVGIPFGNQPGSTTHFCGSARHLWQCSKAGRNLGGERPFSRHVRYGWSPAIPCASYFLGR